MESKESKRALVLGGSSIGRGTLLADNVIIGHPSKVTLNVFRDFERSSGARIGENCILRSGTVVYEDVVLGNEVQVAHNVVIREGAKIGDRCALGNGTIIREFAQLDTNVRLMESVVISEGANVGNNVFIGPNTSFTAGRMMTGALEAGGIISHEDARILEGSNWEGPSVIVKDEVRIGANAVILAGVCLGLGCIVAAGTVVSIDVPDGAMVAGNPCRILKLPPQ